MYPKSRGKKRSKGYEQSLPAAHETSLLILIIRDNRVQELRKGINLSNILDNDRVKFSVIGLYLISMLSLRIAEVKKESNSSTIIS